jgi:hypothetical protein
MLSVTLQTKPIYGTPYDRLAPICTGLGGLYAFNEGGGTVAYDSYGSLPLGLTGFGAANPWGRGSQPALNCAATSNGSTVTLPTQFEFKWPLTIACGVRFLGVPGNHAGLIGFKPNNTQAGPFSAGSLSYSTGSIITCDWNSASTWNSLNTGAIVTTGTDQVWAATIAPTAQTIYLNGISVASAANSLLAPAFAASACWTAGNYPGAALNSNLLLYWAAWWTRALSPQEHQYIAYYPYSMWGPSILPFASTLSARVPYSHLFSCSNASLMSAI